MCSRCLLILRSISQAQSTSSSVLLPLIRCIGSVENRFFRVSLWYLYATYSLNVICKKSCVKMIAKKRRIHFYAKHAFWCFTNNSYIRGKYILEHWFVRRNTWKCVKRSCIHSILCQYFYRG